MPDPKTIPPPPDGSGIVATIPPPPDGSAIVASGTQKPSPPGFFKRLGQSVSFPTSEEEFEKAISPVSVGSIPVAAAGSGLKAIVDYGDNLYEKGKTFLQKPSVESGLDAVTAATPMGGLQKTFAQDAATGNWKGAAGTATGVAAQAALPEAAERAGPKLGPAATSASDMVEAIADHPITRALAKTVDLGTFERLSKIYDAWVNQMPSEMKARAEAMKPNPGILHDQPSATPEQLNPALVSPARTLPGQIPPEKVTPDLPIPGVNVRPSIERIAPPRKGLALPPAPEGAELGDLPSTGAKPAAQTGEALGNMPAPKSLFDLPVKAVNQAIKELGASAPLPQLTERANNIARLGELLNEGLGGKGLEPNVPLKNQGGVVTPKPIEGTVPEGHTPVESTALKSYKYDPQTQEFESVTQNGQHYIHGNISPEEAAAFEAAPSKGRAWQQIRQQGTLVAKVINGKRVPVKPIISDEDLISPEEWEHGHDLETQVEGSTK